MNQPAAVVFDWLEAVSSAVLIVHERQVVWANTAAAALTEYEGGSLQSMAIDDLIAPHWRGQFNPTACPSELQLTMASGNLIWVEIAANATELDGKRVDLLTITNIDQRKQLEHSLSEHQLIENALRESEERYHALLNQSNDCVSLLDLNGNYLLVNDQLASRLGYTVDEMLKMHISQIIVPEEVAHYQHVDRVLKDGNNVPLFERAYRRKDGTIFHGEVNISMVRDAQGTPLYVQSIMRDVEWRLQAEKALRASEERYRIISELISDYAYSFRIEADGTPIHEWITDSFKRMTGFAHEEIDEQGQFALYYPGEEVRVATHMEHVLQGEARSDEYRIVTKDGRLRWVNIFRLPVWDEQQKRVIRMYGVAQDITERKQSEEELRKSEEKYRMITENASDMITRMSTEGICTYASSASRPLLGYEPEELIGTMAVNRIHPDDLPETQQIFAAFLNSHDPFTLVCRMRHKHGKYLWVEVTAKAIRDPDTDEIREYIQVSRDVSHRKQMEAILLEQERLRFELQKEQELNEVKSNLMRTISHEFRTPLTLIGTATEFLDTYFERLDAERRKDRLQAIRIQIKRLSDMLDDISFVVQGALHHMLARPARINLETYCRAVVEEIQTTIGRNHRFVFLSDGQLQEGIADKALVVRIMTNLLSNAVKYSPENSVITVRLTHEGGDALLEVSDEGIGIDPEELKHIFEPFYRGSSVIDQVGGTGLGLSIVKDCIDLHGGTISVQSKPNEGTSFTIRLPQTSRD